MDSSIYSLTKIENMCNGNKEFINQMVDLFIEITPALIAQLHFGLLESDYKKIHFAAHKLKLSINMMEIKSIQSEIVSIEKIAKENGDLSTLNTLITHTNAILNTVILELKTRQSPL